MKKLTRVKLINWHRFTNVTMEMDDSVLISGENGAGKSTFLDAIQFVVNCSANYFNKAAHENRKRKQTLRADRGNQRPCGFGILRREAAEIFHRGGGSGFCIGRAGEDNPIFDGRGAVRGGAVFSGENTQIPGR